MGDWRFHRHVCGDKNTTNIDSESLVMVTNKMIKNYSDIVKEHSGHPVTEWQKNDAKIALVKKLKNMLTGDFQRFNSVYTMADADGDPAFATALADFFAKQPGYAEVWSKMRVGYREYAERQKEIERQNNTLNVSEDHILDCTTTLARDLTVRIGYLQSDCSNSDMVDLECSDRLVMRLVPLVKQFILQHPEYNSHAGLTKLAGSEEFTAKVSEVVCDVMGIGNCQ